MCAALVGWRGREARGRAGGQEPEIASLGELPPGEELAQSFSIALSNMPSEWSFTGARLCEQLAPSSDLETQKRDFIVPMRSDAEGFSSGLARKRDAHGVPDGFVLRLGLPCPMLNAAPRHAVPFTGRFLPLEFVAQSQPLEPALVGRLQKGFYLPSAAWTVTDNILKNLIPEQRRLGLFDLASERKSIRRVRRAR